MIASAYFEQIEKARTARDLFPEDTAARARYRRLARIVHPDVNASDPRAEAAFARLTELWNQYNGSGSPAVLTYATKRHTYEVDGLLASGHIANVYGATYDAGHAHVAIKIPRSPLHSDLIANEITMLKTINTEVPPQFRMYHSTTVDSFRLQSSGKVRRSIVLEKLDGFYTMREVMREYPRGLDGRDLAWMARRLWIALEYAHRAGVAHTAVFPENVMIHPLMHGVVLIDWVHARPFGEKIVTVDKRYLKDGLYGTSFTKPLDHRLDVRQAASTLELLLGLRQHRAFRAFFKGCRVASAPPAGQLFEEFDELLARLYGKRKYRPFTMPASR